MINILLTANLSGFLVCERLFFITITTITMLINKLITIIATTTPPITGTGFENDEDSPVRAEFDITVN